MSDVAVNCPFCEQRGHSPDTTENLNIELTKGFYHCFRCGAKPSVTGALPEALGVLIRNEGGQVWDPQNLVQREQRGIVEDMHYPRECQHCEDYLHGRGFNPRRLSALEDARVLTGGWYMGHRILFRDAETAWWQGRAISPRNTLRYMSPPGRTLAMAPMLSLQPSGATVPVLVEGPFDGLRLYLGGIWAVILFGVNFTEKKLLRLQEILSDVERAVLCLDRDGTENDTQHWAWALAKMLPVQVWQLRAKDPGEMDGAELRALRRLVG